MLVKARLSVMKVSKHRYTPWKSSEAHAGMFKYCEGL